MPSLNSDTITKLYFSMGEVSKALSLEPSAIRFWEKQFLFKGHRNRRGERRYTVDEMGQIALIARLVKYLHIDAAREVYYAGKSDRVLEVLEPEVCEPVGVPMRIVS